MIGYLFYYAFFRLVCIGEQGVALVTPFAKYFINWTDIEEIGIGEYSRIRGNSVPKIYFSTMKMSPRFLENYKTSNQVIITDYKKKIIIETKKYWKGTVDGLSSTSLEL